MAALVDLTSGEEIFIEHLRPEELCFLRQHSEVPCPRGKGMGAQGAPDHTSDWSRWAGEEDL